MSEENKKTVNSVLDLQRKEGEARSLLKDLEKLISLKRERKLRWVWELIQNAVDCYNGKKVNITFTLTENNLIFEHDGDAFQIEHLIALVRKTSTKSVEGLEGKKGKFGTGFVSTHVLNRIVTVSGIFNNQTGNRPFTLLIDRSSDSLPALMQSLDIAFKKIDEINDQIAIENFNDINTSYEYILEEHKVSIAQAGLQQLEQNLTFTLLINTEELNSVTIKNNTNKIISFSIEPAVLISKNIGFSKILNTEINCETGLLYTQNSSFTIAFPATKVNDTYSLNAIGEQARIFRYFPLIGTEKTYFPCFIHSDLFQPTEPRDGIRTLKDFEDRPDKHADKNRDALKQYIEIFKKIFIELLENNVNNLHLLAESGIPEDIQNYVARNWFADEIQKPLRSFLLEQDLVKTVNNETIKIQEAKFIKTFDSEYEAELYVIISELFPSHCPNKDSYRDWTRIIEQDSNSWPQGIYIGIEEVVREVEEKENIDNLIILNQNPVEWLNNLIEYLHKTGKIEMTEQQFAIYPSQSKKFKNRFALRLDPGFDDKFKNITKKIFRNLYDELILDDITNKDGIQNFDTNEFFSSINNFIGTMDCNKASDEQINAIFELGCYFKNVPAPKRAEWFELINILLPNLAKNKILITSLDEFNFEPTDKWTLKYVCLLVEKSMTFKNFCETYFKENVELSYKWFNRFLAFVSRSDEGKDTAFKYAIILTQDGRFKKYEGNLYRESKPDNFNVLFKDLIRDYLGKGDPREYLIDNNITSDYLQEKDVDFLTEQIDKLFNETNIEQSVEDGGKFNSLFHKLNDWYSKEEEINSSIPQSLFPIFRGKRPDLSVRAYGKEMSKIMAEKGMDEIKALTKLTLKSSELSQLEYASKLAGGTNVLLIKAQEIFDEAERIRWRKQVGTSAETAFLEAMQEIETRFDIENPDVGKDFTIISKKTGKEFYLEIKSTIIGEEIVKMSALQGKTANEEKNRYSLCVITRPTGTLIDKDYFIKNVKFVPNIGELIGDKLNILISDLKNLSEHEQGDVNVAMDNKTYSVYVNKKIWEEGIGFYDFVSLLEIYLQSEKEESTLQKNYIWYASYGSNLSKDRFMKYIKGGKPKGSETDYPGCKDKSAPLSESIIILNHELYFAKSSGGWQNGGVAFLEIESTPSAMTYGYMYLITKEQFCEVVKQEIKSEDEIILDFERAIIEGNLNFKNSWYGNLIFVGYKDNLPIFTFTNVINLQPTRRPSENYLQTIITGLKENNKLNQQQILEYLLSKQGIIGNYTEEQLQNLII